MHRPQSILPVSTYIARYPVKLLNTRYCCHSKTLPNIRLIHTFKKCTAPQRIRILKDRIFCTVQRRTANFSSSTKGGTGAQTRSRTERRLIERKERNKAKRKKRASNPDPASDSNFGNNFWDKVRENGIASAFSKSRRLQNLFESFIPRLPGRNVSFTHSSLWIALGMRLPLVVALSYLLTNEDTSPYVIQGSLGPSMLPTIQFAGDIWLIQTGAWGRAWRCILGQVYENSPSVSSLYQVGDIVIWENPKTKKRSCKRIIGLEGDTVHRSGEHNNMYKYRSDFGIIWPRNEDETKDKVFGAYSAQNNDDASQHNENEAMKFEQQDTLVVPNQCVWLEGDCPLFSMDSRQYGPIHVSNIRGKLVYRLWPWDRSDLSTDKEHSYLSRCRVSKDRPIPYPTIEAYLGKRFNFYRVPSSTTEVAPETKSER